MKNKLIPTLIVTILSINIVFSQQMVKTKSIKEFFKNIESGKKLILDLNHYKLEDIIKMAEYDPATKGLKNIKGKRYEIFFTSATYKDSSGIQIVDNAEFYIEFNWLENFQIVGRKTEKDITKLTSSSANIFTFKKCKNILLRNIKIGQCSKGENDGNVIKFEDCEDIKINNCVIFGSGLGLITNKVKNLKVTQSIIENCTKGIIDLTNTIDVVFNECIFQNISGEIKITNTDNFKNIDPISFNKCIFSNLGNNFFALNITKYETIKIDNSIFYGHEENKLTSDKNYLELNKNKFKKAKKN